MLETLLADGCCQMLRRIKIESKPTIEVTQSPPFPRWVRWISLVWLAVWVPSYALYWGWANFLHLCDVAVLLTCIGFARGDVLLLSSQAVSSLVGDVLWCLDAGWRLLAGTHLTGGTEYMWDTRFPFWVRLLSLFHVVLPALLLAALCRTGYDCRALRLQSGIAVVLLMASRLLGSTRNLNYAFADPIFHRAFGPAPVHLAVIFAALTAVIYWPTHLLLARAFRQRFQTSG
jgi:hypothetical protein